MKIMYYFAVLLIFTIAFFSLEYESNIELRNSKIKLSKVELAIRKADHEFNKTRDPKTDKIPANIRADELAFTKGITDSQYYNQLSKNNTAKLQSFEWENVGPNNIAGRMKTIAFDIDNENIILAGSASGGLWRSSDLGESWLKTSEPEAEQTVYCLKQDKREGHHDTWYYGTGELLSTTDRKFNTVARTTGFGNGIYKSTDNGFSWKHLQSTIVYDKSNFSEVFQGVWGIVCDTSDKEKDLVYAACFGAVMISENGGEDWNVTIGDIQNKCFSTDIAITGKGKLYAALSTMTDNGEMPEKTGIWRSNDGINWTDITPNSFPKVTRIIKIELAPSNENILYVLTEKPLSVTGFFSFLASHHTLWKYTYNESSGEGVWEDRTKSLPFQDISNVNRAMSNGFNTLGGYCMTMRIKPDNEDVVFIGGTNLFRSVNGFADDSFQKIGGYATVLHPDLHALAFLPSDSNIMFNCSDGGVTKTLNCMEEFVSWKEVNDGLITAQFYSIDIDKATAADKLIIGGLQDQGSVMISEGNNNYWERIFGGDGLTCAVADNKSFLIVSTYSGYIASGYYLENGYFNMGGGLLSNYMQNNVDFNFFTLFALDPSNNETLYIVGDNSIWRKKNIHLAAKDSELRNIDWTELKNSKLPASEEITAVSLSKYPANRLFFGSNAGKLYSMENANMEEPELINITDDKFPPNGFIACIEIDPENSDNIFAVFSNYNVQSIFYTTDGGGIWEAQGGNLEENPDGGGSGPSIRWIEMMHADDGIIYFAGTSTGLYSTTNLSGVNTVWKREGSNIIGNIKIDKIVSRDIDGYVAVATQGNGVYTATLSGVIDVKENTVNGDLWLGQSYPNPGKNQVQIDFYVPSAGKVTLIVYNFLGKEIATIINNFRHSGYHNVILNTNNYNNGMYFYILETEHEKLAKSFQILK